MQKDVSGFHLQPCWDLGTIDGPKLGMTKPKKMFVTNAGRQCSMLNLLVGFCDKTAFCCRGGAQASFERFANFYLRKMLRLS